MSQLSRKHHSIMQSIQDLLNRIRWDPEFSQGDFEIGFLDHCEDHEIRIHFKAMGFDTQDHFFFHYFDKEGVEHDVPLHRIKSVYQDGQLIWHREH